MAQAFKNDDKKILLDPSNTHRVRDLIKKIKRWINKQGINDKKLRSIPLNLAKRPENGRG